MISVPMHYQFKSPFYPSSSCEDIYNKNPESQDKSGSLMVQDMFIMEVN